MNLQSKFVEEKLVELVNGNVNTGRVPEDLESLNEFIMMMRWQEQLSWLMKWI